MVRIKYRECGVLGRTQAGSRHQCRVRRRETSS